MINTLPNPKVTVLMAVYNGEKYLREAIDSILCQTFRDFEFLIINDGSKDSSRDIILSYKDHRIRLVDNHTNIGLTKSLNRGLSMSQGEFIARQDADDLSLDCRLKHQYDYLSDNPEVDVLGAQASLLLKGKAVRGGLLNWKSCSYPSIKWEVIFDSPLIHSSVMLRKSKIFKNGGGYDEEFVTSQDYALWSKIVYSHRVQNLPNYLVVSRIHNESISKNYKIENLGRVGRLLKEHANVYLKNSTVAEEWSRIWLCINNSNVISDDVKLNRCVFLVNSLMLSFRLKYPKCNLIEILRHKSTIWYRVAAYCMRKKWRLQGTLFILRAGLVLLYSWILRFYAIRIKS
jgi:glycosyltransferase involved in cell wall biosynthesis